MQAVSDRYKVSMKQPYRNRGHIRAWIGVINMDAQSALDFSDPRNNFAEFSSGESIIALESVTRPYATCEENFSAVDGSMFFMPEEGDYYHQGLVTENLVGTIYITFGGQYGFDIKGLTIDFGSCYPTRFRIISNNGTHEYENNASEFVTEDTFNNTSFFTIQALEMLGGRDRLRITKFNCGITNVFSNDNVESFFFSDYSSTLADSLPSHDMRLTVFNYDLYYSPDNPDSTIAYLEQGQEVEVSFGYDVEGDGVVEWIPPIKTYLKTWSANDSKAVFNAVDILEFKLGGTYYRGLYRENGITLYDLAVDVFEDGGIFSDGYFIDPYLKTITVQNPLPVTSHANCIQIIANAGRCSMLLERGNKIVIKAQFIPDMTISANSEAPYSNVQNIMLDTKKDAYAATAYNFSVVDGSLKFYPHRGTVRGTFGYISDSIYDGTQWIGEVPKITVTFESAWVFYGMMIRFKNVAPEEFTITYFKDNIEVSTETISNPTLDYEYHDVSPETDKFVLTITKGALNAGVWIDNILINDVTDYNIRRDGDLVESAPNSILQNKIKSISVKRKVYRRTSDQKSLVSGEVSVGIETIVERVVLQKASYGYSVSVTEGNATATIVSSSSYYVDIRIVSNARQTVKYTLMGYEYIIDEPIYTKTFRVFGEVVNWDNPLVSTTSHAKEMEEWLESYYLGDVDYDFNWRGDPRVDANDLFYLELKDRDDALIRAYQSELTFNGAWRGHIKARKAVVSWR